ncbi:MAG: hypothetical protein IJX66_07840 [Lachnospiraceae bacterium]|nr:hypothetical protein [Lachnospiraceae bacterium]
MKKNRLFVMVTIGLIMIIVLSVAKTAECQSQAAERNREEYYVKLEKEYVAELRDYLNGEGFLNSGVMLTRIVSEDGSREYTITVHNSRFDRLTEWEKEILLEEMEQKAFEEENCSFVHSLSGNA